MKGPLNVPSRDLRVGDVLVDVLGCDRIITGIAPYRGRLATSYGMTGWLVGFKPGPAQGMSVWEGEHHRVRRP